MVVGDVTTGTDVLVIGGGPGGYVAAIRAGQLDLDVTLVEMDAYGGTCLNHGCIPSKALISAGDLAHRAGAAEDMGVYADPAVDLGGMVDWKDGIVTRLTRGVQHLCEQAGVTLVSGRAEFAGPNRARIVPDGEGQGAESIEFEHSIVATGSRPIELPNISFDGENILSSREVLALDTLPESLLVVGAGYIGMELATVFAKLGTSVTVLEQLEQVLPTYEEDVAAVVQERATELGVEFHFGETASGWDTTEDGIVLHSETADGTEDRAADVCLVAVGRTPVTDTLGLEEIALEPSDRGFLETDDRCRTALEHIFAVGDVAGEPMLAHSAFREGQVAAEVIAGQPSAVDNRAVPAAVFTDPEIATVGLTEAAAREADFEPVVGQMPLQANGRALTVGEREGFARIVADAESEVLLGAQLVGPEASELIAELGLAIEMGATLEDLAATIHVHPTLSEAVHEAAMGARGAGIHY